jgi:hypothetical protein
MVARGREPHVGVAAMLAPGLFVWNQFVTVPNRCRTGRGRQPAMAVELPPAGRRRKARPRRDARTSARKSARRQQERPNGLDDVIIEGDELHLPVGKPVHIAAALDRCPARFLCAGIPRQDGHDPRHRHLFLVHADADGNLRGSLRRALRRRPSANARHRRGRDGGRLSGVAGQQQTFAQMLASGEPQPQT